MSPDQKHPIVQTRADGWRRADAFLEDARGLAEQIDRRPWGVSRTAFQSRSLSMPSSHPLAFEGA